MKNLNSDYLQIKEASSVVKKRGLRNVSLAHSHQKASQVKEKNELLFRDAQFLFETMNSTGPNEEKTIKE